MNKLVLFDFDGTLADTAPDLGAAINVLRARRGLPELPLEKYRSYASHGARGLLKAGLGMDPDHPEYDTARDEFLTEYEQGMTHRTTLFPGIKELLAGLRENGYTWGIVTNKVEYLAVPLVVHLGLYRHCAITVGGDTTPHPKPHPAPLLHAAEKTGFAPQDAIYIGDDQRDIVAGRAAGMATVVAAYGYCGADTTLHAWEATAIARQPENLWGLIEDWARG
ncbi:HAD-IA family hydrolase [Alcaligenaceae bacterium]|nr:HAD-IA family hydrolase [Alcaligenaceae bacterium]